MKILLLEEFSGLHTFLKKGLEQLGCEVTLASRGDGFKEIHGDIPIRIISKNKILIKLESHIKMLFLLKKFRKYDVVQLLHPIPVQSFISSFFYIKVLKIFNRKVFLNSCSSEPITVSNFLKYSYSPLQNEIKEEKLNGLYQYLSSYKYRWCKKIALEFDGIIGTMFEYHDPYKNFSNYLGFIPMPIELDTQNLEFKKKHTKQKIKIFHGITRYEFKGSSYILEAMKQLQKNYPDKCEITIVEKVPYKEYIKLFNDCDLFIDQACSYGYGMNALLGLAKGKIVLSGAEKLAVEDLQLKNCPIINIIPDAGLIYNTLKILIHKDSDYFNEMHRKAITFINTTHEHKLVAKKYLEKWALCTKDDERRYQPIEKLVQGG